MKLSIVICCFNSGALLSETIAKIVSAASFIPKDSMELVVVDNASTDNTYEIARTSLAAVPFLSQLISEPKKGLMNARLAGISHARAEYVCFLDDDNWPTDSYFARVTEIFAQYNEVGVIGVANSLPPERTLPEAIVPYAQAYAIGCKYQYQGILAAGMSIWGAGLAVRRSAVVALMERGFHPVLNGRVGTLQLAGDDCELCMALALCGWKVWHDTEVLIVHNVAASRFTSQKLTSMYRGFGASVPFLKRYIRRSEGQRFITGRFYPVFYFFWIVMKFLKLAFKTGSSKKGAPYELEFDWATVYSFRLRSQLWKRQLRNIDICESLHSRRGFSL